LPAVFSPSIGTTPESMTATSTPAPVYPASHMAEAPVISCVTRCSEPLSPACWSTSAEESVIEAFSTTSRTPGA
jgi:hypothetical protein